MRLFSFLVNLLVAVACLLTTLVLSLGFLALVIPSVLTRRTLGLL